MNVCMHIISPFLCPHVHMRTGLFFSISWHVGNNAMAMPMLKLCSGHASSSACMSVTAARPHSSCATFSNGNHNVRLKARAGGRPWTVQTKGGRGLPPWDAAKWDRAAQVYLSSLATTRPSGPRICDIVPTRCQTRGGCGAGEWGV